ncbi:MAG: hypothetical protein HC774_07490 [Sphingomonadales bacterium]|nr:hypothetical protein [Sphingomonadales bacterium]
MVTLPDASVTESRHIGEYTQTTGALIREYVWLGWEPIAVIECGAIAFVRTDHIGRPVFATNATGVKVWTVADGWPATGKRRPPHP